MEFLAIALFIKILKSALLYHWATRWVYSVRFWTKIELITKNFFVLKVILYVILFIMSTYNIVGIEFEDGINVLIIP